MGAILEISYYGFSEARAVLVYLASSFLCTCVCVCVCVCIPTSQFYTPQCVFFMLELVQ